jgi:hypothetical protein
MIALLEKNSSFREFTLDPSTVADAIVGQIFKGEGAQLVLPGRHNWMSEYQSMARLGAERSEELRCRHAASEYLDMMGLSLGKRPIEVRRYYESRNSYIFPYLASALSMW